MSATRGYLLVSAIIFLLVAIMHALRLYHAWAIQVGPQAIPVEASWIGLVIALVLCIWGFSSLRR